MLPYGKQWIDEDDISEVVRVLKSDYLTTGPEIPLFESDFAKAVGAKYAHACANGTAALHLISLAMDLKPGDQVIVPSISFVATANGPRYTGAEIIFADVDPQTALATPETIKAAIGRTNPKRLKAIFVVHMGGHTVDMLAMRQIANEHGVYLVEDACHALGSTYQDASGVSYQVCACAHSDFASMSLHPVKTITCGEGGVVLTNHDEMAAKLGLLRNHGLAREADSWMEADLAFDEDGSSNPWYYELQVLGYNYRLTDFQAAMGRSQLKKLPMFVERRRALVARYRELIGQGSDTLSLVPAPDYANSTLHLMVALIDFKAIGKSRRQVMQALREQGVGTQVHYIPIHRQPYYQTASSDTPELPGADAYYAKCLSLPLYPLIEISEVDTVVRALEKVISA
jgi:UDP-4-amino-4,6-dideoxy-N-acetyl-beta-L-altrosamine transaminase